MCLMTKRTSSLLAKAILKASITPCGFFLDIVLWKLDMNLSWRRENLERDSCTLQLHPR